MASSPRTMKYHSPYLLVVSRKHEVDDGADDRSLDRAHPADDGDEDEVRRPVDAERRRRLHPQKVDGHDRAHQLRNRRRR